MSPAGTLDLIGPVDGLVTDAEVRRVGIPVGDDVNRSLELLRRP